MAHLQEFTILCSFLPNNKKKKKNNWQIQKCIFNRNIAKVIRLNVHSCNVVLYEMSHTKL